MMKILFATIFLLNVNLTSFSQQPSKIIGEWTILEMQSDRISYNFETDSIVIFNTIDRDNYNIGEAKKLIKELVKMIAPFAINFLDNNSFVSKFNSMEETGEYAFNPKSLIIILKGPAQSDTLKLTANGHLEYDMSDDYENRIIRFKRKVKTTRP